VTFRTRILLAQAPLGLALILGSGLFLATLARLAGSSRAVLKDNFLSVLSVEAMKESLERLDSAALLLVAGERKKGLDLSVVHREAFERALQEEESNVTETGEDAVARDLRLRWTEYVNCFDELAALRGTKIRPFYFSNVSPAFQSVKERADAILTMNQDAMRRKDNRVKRLADRVRGVALAATVAALIGGLILSSGLTSRVLRPLNVLGQAVRRIGEGDWDARVRLPGGDELSQLATDINAALDKLKVYRDSSLGDLLQANEAAQIVLDALPDPVVIFGISGDVRNINQAAREVGFDQDTLPMGEPFKPLRDAVERAREHVLAGRGAYVPRGFEEAVSFSSGDEERFYLPRAAPVYESRRAVTGAAVVLQDVTRAKRMEELEGDWVATVAHEFKTPLTSLRMAVHLCLEGTVGPMTEKQTDLLNAGREDCERLQALVDELLDLSRLSSARMELRPGNLRAADLLRGAAKAHQSRAKAKDVSLRVTAPAEELSVLADPDRLPLVLSNLVANAVRHTPDGGAVELSARSVETGARFEVSDTGSGVPPDQRERIFEKFTRLTGSEGGAGLGLYIAREIITAHGGRIGVEDRPGGGSLFWFTVPRAASGNL
jgi:NtrC-family two-component system sensor histidine kinase KinB